MQGILSHDRLVNFSKSSNTKAASSPAASAASEEIHSYLRIRDLLLSQAAEAPTEANLHRAWMANEFAEKCLRPARSLYEAQSLPEAEAARERQRCKAVKVRVAELRARIGARNIARQCRAA